MEPIMELFAIKYFFKKLINDVVNFFVPPVIKNPEYPDPKFDENTENTEIVDKISIVNDDTIYGKITFTFDENSVVNVTSEMHEEFNKTLVNIGAIKSSDANDETILHYAMVVLANEATNQIIDEISGN